MPVVPVSYPQPCVRFSPKERQSMSYVLNGLSIPSETFALVPSVDRLDVVEARKLFDLLGVEYTCTYTDPLYGAIWAEHYKENEITRTACIYRKQEQGKPNVDVITLHYSNKVGTIELDLFKHLNNALLKHYTKTFADIIQQYPL